MAVNGEDNHAVIKLAVRIFISLTMLGLAFTFWSLPIGRTTIVRRRGHRMDRVSYRLLAALTALALPPARTEVRIVCRGG